MPVPDPDQRPAQQPARRPRMLASSVVLWVVGLVCMLAYSRQGLRTDFFFDEAWRSDIIRSSHPFRTMRTINTPIPPLWPWILHFTSGVLGGRFRSLRLQGAALAAICPALAGQMVRVLRPPGHRRGPEWSHGLFPAVVATVAVSACLDGSSVATYFNDYAFQGAVALALVLVLYFVDQGWLPAMWVVPAVLAVVLGTISGLFLLPAVAWWALRPDRRRLRVVVLPALAAGGALAVALYVRVYRPQVDSELKNFWADDVLRHGTRSLFSTVVHLVRTAGGFLHPVIHQDISVLPLGFLLLGLGVTGFVHLHRQWPWLGRMGAGAWAIAAVGSVVASWPVTTVRVNLPFLMLWLVAAFVGLTQLAERVAPRVASAIVVVIVTFLAIASLPDQYPRNHLFAKGLDADLHVVRDSPAREVVVIGYHWMSAPYLHDGLVNRRPDAGRYRIIQDTLAHPLDDHDLPSLVAPLGLVSGDEVWCVVPYESGPAVAAHACTFGAPRFERITSVHGTRADIIGYRVTAAG